MASSSPAPDLAKCLLVDWSVYNSVPPFQNEPEDRVVQIFPRESRVDYASSPNEARWKVWENITHAILSHRETQKRMMESGGVVFGGFSAASVAMRCVTKVPAGCPVWVKHFDQRNNTVNYFPIGTTTTTTITDAEEPSNDAQTSVEEMDLEVVDHDPIGDAFFQVHLALTKGHVPQQQLIPEPTQNATFGRLTVVLRQMNVTPENIHLLTKEIIDCIRRNYPRNYTGLVITNSLPLPLAASVGRRLSPNVFGKVTFLEFSRGKEYQNAGVVNCNAA